ANSRPDWVLFLFGTNDARTQGERTRAVVASVKEAASVGDGKVILVGHSAGGMTISAVAEQVPELLVAVVYIAGFMVPNGLSLLAILP
ncbi:alpha/beta fold hydrolase, partial [Rhizobium ruizarguesonis]